MTAPTTASRFPKSDAGEEPPSPSAITAAPAMATGIATWTATGGFSPRKTRDITVAKSGAVLTSKTEAATEVCDRLAIQVAKCSASATPAATSSRWLRRSSAGQERRASPQAKGSRITHAIDMR